MHSNNSMVKYVTIDSMVNSVTIVATIATIVWLNM